MIREIELNGKIIQYNFQYKNVKNINLRIKADMTVNVSASRFVSLGDVEAFLVSKSDFILKALDKFSMRPCDEPCRCFDDTQIRKIIEDICQRIYPYYQKRGISYPQIRFRKMISQWGNCYPKRGILTFNTNLVYAPYECVEYVVYHEFTHFLQANHSREFYEELQIVCPDWKKKREMLKKIRL